MNLASVLTLGLLALFLACQPWSVLAGVLLVSSRGGVRKNACYAVGWMLALAAVAIATTIFYPEVPQSSGTSRGLAITEVVAGTLLGGWLYLRWRRPAQPGTSTQPKWMGRVDSMSSAAALALGAFLPSYVIVVAAVSEMLDSGLEQGKLAIAATVWVLLATVGVAAPLGVLVLHPDRAPETYERWRAWIVANSRTVLYAVGGLVCVVLIGKGIVALA